MIKTSIAFGRGIAIGRPAEAKRRIPLWMPLALLMSFLLALLALSVTGTVPPPEPDVSGFVGP